MNNKLKNAMIVFIPCVLLLALTYFGGGFKWGTPDTGLLLGFGGFIVLMLTGATYENSKNY